MDDLQFYIFYNSISVISGQWKVDNKRLCALEPCSGLKRFLHSVGLEPGTARSAGQCLLPVHPLLQHCIIGAASERPCYLRITK